MDRFTADCNRVERAVRELEGYNWDNTFWGKARINRYSNYSSRPYYVGVKNESTATIAVLKM
jgi:hypothetical protein